MNARKLLTALVTATLVTTALAACGGDDPEDDATGSITVWSLENQTDRVQATQAIADEFTAQTGIQGQDRRDRREPVHQPDHLGRGGRQAARRGRRAAAGRGGADGARNDLLDTDAAKAVVDELGRGTFSPRALELTAQDGNQLAVPVGRLGAAALLPQGPVRQGRPRPRRTPSTRSAPPRRS